MGLSLSEKEISILARQGSGSACRSIPDGFVEWRSGENTEDSYATSLYKADYWDVIDIVVVLSKEKKITATTTAHTSADTSPFFKTRIATIDEKIKRFKKSLEEKDFLLFGSIVEQEALEMHAIMLTQIPWFCYFSPETIQIIKAIKSWRDSGLSVYFTINTGANVHVLCQKKEAEKVQAMLMNLSYVQETIYNSTAVGTREINDHLF